MTIKKGLSRLGILLLILIALCMCLTPILQKKWTYEADSAATEIANGYYAEPQNSLDVLYLGTSYMKNGMSPLEIWKAYGITGYTRASAQQAPLVSYYLAKETFKTQKPKVVVFEAATLIQAETSESNDYDKRETKLHEVLDFMPLSAVKLQMAREIVQNSALSYSDLLVPLYRYHDRWTEITEDDFVRNMGCESYPYKGQYPAIKVASYTEDADFMKKGGKMEEAQIDGVTADFVLRLQKLCRRNGAQLILLHMPNVSWDDNKSNVIKEFADSNGLVFLDYASNELRKAIGYDSKTDSIDYGLHMNLRGAEKISKHFGNYLNSHFKFEDKRQNPDYAQWNVDYDLYMEEKKAEAICQDSSFSGLLKKLEGSGFIGIFASKSDVGTHFTQDIHEQMKRIGLTADLSSPLYMSYVGITDGTNAVFEKMAGEEISYEFEVEGKEISVLSNTRRGQNSSVSIQIDGVEESLDQNGLNVVVYSPKLGRVITSRRYNIGVNGSVLATASPLDSLSLRSYLEEIGDSRYITTLAVTKDATMCLAPKDAALIQAMGFSINLEDRYARPYIAVSNGGYGVLEMVGEKFASTVSGSVDVDNVHISVSSEGGHDGEGSRIVINGEEYVCPYSGLNFVVYDRFLQKVVSVRRFSTGSYSFTDYPLYSQKTVDGFLSAALEKENYTTIISVRGEIKKSDMSALSNVLLANGLQTHMDAKPDTWYTGIIDNGEICFESNDAVIDETYFADYKKIIVRQGSEEKKNGILIDNINYLIDENGIQIAVFDKVEGTVVRRVRFGA